MSKKNQPISSCQEKSQGTDGEAIYIKKNIQSGPIDIWQYLVLTTIRFPYFTPAFPIYDGSELSRWRDSSF